MFAYCWNNPVIRSDEAGTDPLTQATADDTNPLDDYENFGRLPGGGGGGFRADFMRSLRSGLKGLDMALGKSNISHIEKHHLFSNKNKIYTPQYQEVFDRYNILLTDSDNIVSLNGHSGRHTNVYHVFMLSTLHTMDHMAGGNVSLFREGLKILQDFHIQNPGLPYVK